MMPHDLERLIDRAAEQMVRREPSDALTDAVMAGIVDRPSSIGHRRSSIVHRPSSIVQRRVAWAAAGAGAVACVALAVLMLNSIPPQVVDPARAPALTPSVVAGETAPSLPPAAEGTGNGGVAVVVRAARPIAVLQMPLADEIARGIDPIAVESIPIESIEVPLVQIAAAEPIAQIEVEPIIVEPLSASNN